ncbi:hypothetical protein TrRE_jg6289, partial [Triparma retinervis]
MAADKRAPRSVTLGSHAPPLLPVKSFKRKAHSLSRWLRLSFFLLGLASPIVSMYSFVNPHDDAGARRESWAWGGLLSWMFSQTCLHIAAYSDPFKADREKWFGSLCGLLVALPGVFSGWVLWHSGELTS